MGLLLALAGVVSAALSITKAVSVIGLAIEGLKVVANALVNIGKALGLIRQDIEPEELGDKAIQAEEAGIRPENYRTYEEYVKEIEQFEVDPEKSKQISEEAKQYKALELSAGLLAEKIPEADILSLMITAQTPNVLSPEKMAAMIEILKEKNGVETFNSMVGFLNNTEKNPAKAEMGLHGLINIEKTLNPSMNSGDALRAVLDSAEKIQKGTK